MMRNLWKAILVAAVTAAALTMPAQPAQAGSWWDWENLGRPAGVTQTSSPAAASWGWGHLDVFVVADGAMWHMWYFEGSGWSGWDPLGTPPNVSFIYHPSAVSWGVGRVDVFAVGSDNALWHNHFEDGGWGTWESRGGHITAAPAATSGAVERMDVFVRGPSDAMWRLSYDHGWTADWVSLGGTITSAPAAVSMGPDTILTWAKGLNGKLWFRGLFPGSWHDWREWLGPLDLSVDGSPAQPLNVVGGLSAFPIGGRFNLLAMDSRGVAHFNSWHWHSIGASNEGWYRPEFETPTAASWGDGRIDVFVTLPGHNLWHRSWG